MKPLAFVPKIISPNPETSTLPQKITINPNPQPFTPEHLSILVFKLRIIGVLGSLTFDQ
jgi:hypothetical protein